MTRPGHRSPAVRPELCAVSVRELKAEVRVFYGQELDTAFVDFPIRTVNKRPKSARTYVGAPDGVDGMVDLDFYDDGASSIENLGACSKMLNTCSMRPSVWTSERRRGNGGFVFVA